MKKKFLLLFVLVFSCINFYACSEDNDNEEYSSGWAPENLKSGQIIGWKGYYMYPGDDTHYSESVSPDETFIEIINSNSCKASWSKYIGNYTYYKTDNNTAELNISVVQSVPGNTRSFKYNAVLKFTDKKQFSMTGTKTVTNSISSGYYVSNLYCTGTLK